MPLHLLTSSTTEAYLRDRGELDSQESVRITELSGGVSNEVLLVERGRGDRFVLKQAREQLRVKDDWRCDIRRIWREIDVLRLCGEILRQVNLGRESGIAASVPGVLFEDRENYCYAMTAAPAEHQTWKQRLMNGHVERDCAVEAGRLLAQLHAGTWHDESVAQALDDRSYFDALRLDPYYRRAAQVHPQLRSEMDALIDSVWRHRCCLTHGDFSPKNLLVSHDGLMLIDFEVGHYGDPAFDVGFCLTHLVLKSIWAGSQGGVYLQTALDFWHAYALRFGLLVDDRGNLQHRCVMNLAGCLLARVDGKSPVDYLAEESKQLVRELASQWLRSPPPTMAEAFAALEHLQST